MKAAIIEDGRVEIVGTLTELEALRDNLTSTCNGVREHAAAVAAAANPAQAERPVSEDNHTIAVYVAAKETAA